MSTIPNLPIHWNISDFTFAMPQFATHPNYFYARLQTESPVHRMKNSNAWIITRYEECTQVLNDKRLATTSGSRVEQAFPEHEQLSKMGKHMLSSDPPDHTRMRSVVSNAFTKRSIDRLRDRMISATQELLGNMIDRGEADLMNDFAFHLPAIIIAELLGVPLEDRAMFRIHSNAVTQSIGSDAAPVRQMAGLKAELALADYFNKLIEKKREQPSDDLITALIQAGEHNDLLRENEVVSTCILLLIAGHETMANLIGNGILALLEHPDQMALLRREPELTLTAIEEMMRFTSPIQRVGRRTEEPIEIAGCLIAAEQRISVILAAANRDPAVFKEPERFDITRNPNPHIGFGRGIHFCLGAPLARLEAEIAFPLLLDRLPNLRLAHHSLEWNPSTVFRGLKSLPVIF